METETLTFEQFIANVEAHRTEWKKLLTALQKDIGDDYRTTLDTFDDESDPGMDVTIATTDGESWSYQTGDNSYSGSAYHFQHWAVIYLYRDSDIDELVDDVIDQLCELFYS